MKTETEIMHMFRPKGFVSHEEMMPTMGEGFTLADYNILISNN